MTRLFLISGCNLDRRQAQAITCAVVQQTCQQQQQDPDFRVPPTDAAQTAGWQRPPGPAGHAARVAGVQVSPEHPGAGGQVQRGGDSWRDWQWQEHSGSSVHPGGERDSRDGDHGWGEVGILTVARALRFLSSSWR